MSNSRLTALATLQRYFEVDLEAYLSRPVALDFGVGGV